MSWTVIPASQLSNHHAAWNALAQTMQGAPFLQTSFIQPALSAFGNGQEQLCLYHHEQRLCAAAILHRSGAGQWETFQPSQLPLGAWLSDGAQDLSQLEQSLMARLPGLVLGLGLTQQDPHFVTRPLDGPRVRSQDYIQTAWVNIDMPFDAYWEARGKNLKQNTRKQRNKLQTEGTATTLECITHIDAVAQAMVDYGNLESAGWKTESGTAVHPDNAQGRFYRQMLENFCAEGRARIYRYKFDDKVVAMDLCIHDEDFIVILKTTYDESYKAVSPSTLMRQAEFEQLFNEQKFKRIEFYGKVMEWHTRWTTDVRTLFHTTFYRHAFVLAALNFKKKVLQPQAAKPAALGAETP